MLPRHSSIIAITGSSNFHICFFCFCTGFKNEAESFFIYVLILMLASMCGCCYAFVMSLTVAAYSVVILLVSTTFIIMLVSEEGFLIM